MADYRNILVAVDFSDVSAAALKVAVDISKRLGAQLKVLHVVQPQPVPMPLEGSAIYMDEVQTWQLEEAEKSLDLFIQQHIAPADVAVKKVRAGVAAAEISRAATDIGADLIVMGTHGRSGLRHLLMGSIAESVLRVAPVPVLCVRS
ncbi:MAG: universal stress protein [Gammaproteobacteria bacterium]|nr:universal stress protein [Gammaproteobacteria bacterium]